MFAPHDNHSPEYTYLFLQDQPEGTTGLARRLNPETFYIAMRWDYAAHPPAKLRHSFVKVTNPKTGKSIRCRPTDWGPNIRTGRMCDLSPGALCALDVATDDIVEVDPPTPC